MNSIPRFSYDNFDRDDSSWTLNESRHFVTNNMFDDAVLKEEISCFVIGIESYFEDEVCEYVVGDIITLPPGTKLSTLIIDVTTSIDPEEGQTEVEWAARGYLDIFKDKEIIFMIDLEIILQK